MPSYPKSPLRYPGGKASLYKFLADVLSSNGMKDGTYVEPYAGGAGAALELLFSEHVDRIILNDVDPCIFAFWDAVLRNNDQLVDLIRQTPITIEEWIRQREIYRSQAMHPRLNVAFATLYLNRCNRSGIIANAGPIGGFGQEKWTIDARYNRQDLINRIERIHLYRERILVYNMDAIEFLKSVMRLGRQLDSTLIYLDPPYYLKGCRLYLNYYEHSDHAKLARYLKGRASLHWILTYDEVPEIQGLYKDCHQILFHPSYSAHTRRDGRELLIHRGDLIIPRQSLAA